MTRLACALLLAAAVCPAQIVEGTVVNAVSGMGIAGVQVSLYQGPDRYYDATSDAQGRFLFDHVQDGVYTAQYSSPDYQPTGMLPPDSITVVKGNPVKLEERLMPSGRLSGRVLDPQGKPVSGAMVQIAGPGIMMMHAADADGKFEMHQLLHPGGYTISATAPQGFHPPAAEPGSGEVLSWVRTYFPSVADPDAASKVEVPPGGDVGNIDIKLLSATSHALRGVLLDPRGKPASKVTVRLIGLQGSFQQDAQADGAFEFRAVVDGHWRLAAEVPPTSAAAVNLAADLSLDMEGKDREDIKLQLHEPFTIHATVVMDTPRGIPAPKPRAVLLVDANRSFGVPLRLPGAVAKLEADGSTTLSQVYPDTYEVSPLNPPGYYLDSVRVGGVQISSPIVEIAAPVPIVAYFKGDGGTVRGTVEDCGAGGVLLVAQDPSIRWMDRFQPSGRCDAKGRYEFTGVRPGDYYLIATAPPPQSFFWDPRWSDALINQATGITVKAGETSTVDLKAIAAN